MIEIIKPELTHYAMCIYKFTFSNGFYYYGATSDLGERISRHKERFRDRKFPKKILDAYDDSTFVKFEIVRFVNDRAKLAEVEETFLCAHVGLPKCLNSVITCTSAFKRGEAVFKVAKVSLNGEILKVYDSPTIAAVDLGISRNRVEIMSKSKYPRGEYALRRLTKEGIIEIPVLPYNDCSSSMKPVIQYDLQMNYVARFESIGDASRKSGQDRKGISKVINGQQHTCGGFIFKIADK